MDDYFYRHERVRIRERAVIRIQFINYRKEFGQNETEIIVIYGIQKPITNSFD
jgi:hypothetical protein